MDDILPCRPAMDRRMNALLFRNFTSAIPSSIMTRVCGALSFPRAFARFIAVSKTSNSFSFPPLSSSVMRSELRSPTRSFHTGSSFPVGENRYIRSKNDLLGLDW